MGLFKGLKGFLGLAKDEEAENNADLNATSSSSSPPVPAAPFAASSQSANHLHRKGFSVAVQVPVDRTPIIVSCDAGDGGVQGFKWFGMRLRVDEEGDAADEFLDQVSQDKSTSMEDHEPTPRFEVKYSTRPAKVKDQVTLDGKLQNCVEYQDRLVWV